MVTHVTPVILIICVCVKNFLMVVSFATVCFGSFVPIEKNGT